MPDAPDETAILSAQRWVLEMDGHQVAVVMAALLASYEELKGEFMAVELLKELRPRRVA